MNYIIYWLKEGKRVQGRSMLIVCCLTLFRWSVDRLVGLNEQVSSVHGHQDPGHDLLGRFCHQHKVRIRPKLIKTGHSIPIYLYKLKCHNVLRFKCKRGNSKLIFQM